MSDLVNETHDPNVRSWIESANDPHTDFPIQNLPFGVFKHRNQVAKIGVAIGDQIFDIGEADAHNLFPGASKHVAELCHNSSLNLLMRAGHFQLGHLRRRLIDLLREDNPELRDNQELAAKIIVPSAEAKLLLPVDIGDYTDFYASIHHATNVGKMFRPDQPLMPNYKWMPIGYHGRASSVVVSETPIVRPQGQTKAPDSGAPTFGPTRLLDYELEVGFFVGQGNEHGQPIGIRTTEQHIFGLCLVNDWSARDVQSWEYQPLGPFLAKSFATTISPWIVTMEALAPFRVSACTRANDDPQPLAHLDSPENQAQGGFDIQLDVLLLTAQMRERRLAPHRLSRSNTQDLYWTFAQMLAHHSSNGCNLRAGDLLASGTVSGATKDSFGCLLELTQRGTAPIELPSGETRRFLQDGDEVILRAACEREGFRRIGFGECRGGIQPAIT